MPSPPRRRWYQFSLRTMFVAVIVVAIPLSCVGRQYQLYRERQAFIRGVILDKSGFGVDGVLAAPDISFWRRYFGDAGVSDIAMPRASTADGLSKARKLFPEASIIWRDHIYIGGRVERP